MNATPASASITSNFQLDLITVIPSFTLSFLAFVCNALLLLVLFCDPFRQFRTPSTVFVANLAVADALTGILTLLKTIFFSTGFPALAGIGLFLTYSSLWSMQCSLFTVLFITGERLLAVLNPIKFKSLVTKCRTFSLSLGTWVLSSVNFHLSNIFKDRSYNLSTMVVNIFNLLAICLTVAGYFALYKLLRKQRNEIDRYAVPENGGRSSNDIASLRRKQKAFTENKKLVSTFLIVTIVLVVSMAPVMIVALTFIFCSSSCRQHILVVLPKYEPLVMVNFVVNPVIYAFRLPQYRKAFWTLFRCARPSNAISNLQLSLESAR